MKKQKYSKGRTLAVILLLCLMALIFTGALFYYYHGDRRGSRATEVTAALAASGIVGLASFIYLLGAAGHREGSDEVQPGPLEKIPYDVFAVITLSFAGIALAIASEVLFYRESNLVDFFLLAVSVLAAGLVLLLFCMSTAVRIKTHTFWNNWLVLRIIRRLSVPVRKAGRILLKGLKELPLFRRDLLIAAALCFLEWLLITWTPSYDPVLGVILVIKDVILLSGIAWLLLGMQKLREGTKALASGDFSKKISTDHLAWELREHAEDLNRISDGMSAAVEEQLKSERLRTELITNVSHDIKTPLTSVINYVDLLEKTKPEDETVREYLDVLSRQSTKLKKLIEDLIEASKAATGNLTVHPEPCDLTVLMHQVLGEYSERLEEAGLTPIVSCPEEPVMILADGRHMWRILDNLMNNICKYAQQGTRVYLSLERENGNALMTFRNISRDALNIRAEELTERFTRGDSSRNTEGNGLGLAIADSLTKLQGGQMKLILDGDLFKVQLQFPLRIEKE